MKQVYLLSLLCLWGIGLSFGQNAQVTRVDFPKVGKVDAATISFNGDSKNVEAVMEEKMQRETGEKPKGYKGGFEVMYAVRHRSISGSAMDIFYKVDKGGSKDYPQSQVFLVLSHGNESFLDEAGYSDEFRAAKQVLEELPREVEMYELSLLIDGEQKNLDKARKDFEKMGKDSVDLELKLTETQQAIEDNKALLEQQRILLQDQEALLEDYKKRLEEVRGRKD